MILRYLSFCTLTLVILVGSGVAQSDFEEYKSSLDSGFTQFSSEVEVALNEFIQQHDSLFSEYLKRIYSKTASLFELATIAPAMLSSIMETSADAAQRFGFGIGMAFQIIDDVLDFTGKQDAVGKPVANDLRQGLVTLPTIYYLESHPDDSNLSMILSRKEVGEEQLAQLVCDIQESGAIEKSVDKAKNFISQALDALDELPLTPEHQALENLSKYIVDRHL